MLTQALLAAVERGLNRVLALDSTALPRLARLDGRIIAVRARAPAFSLFIYADGQGVTLASHWEGAVDCTLEAPTSALLRLALAKDKQAVLHEPDVDLDGDSSVLMALAGVLQDLDLDWEYELSRWIGPVPTALIAGHLRSRANWTRDNLNSLQENFADYLSEESRTLVGRLEAEARFAELDELKLSLDRLDARLQRLAQRHKPIA